MFRMHRPSFWQLVNILKDASERGYWDGREYVARTAGGRPPRPAYQQIAVTLYLLGAAGGGRECSGINLNIGKGTVTRYIQHTIKLLVTLLPQYVRWPTAQQRIDIDPPTAIFQCCVGFLDGSVIILRYKPMVDPEAYFSQKSTYGFNIQAICDWERRFIWVSMGHTASAHDSTAFKSTSLYHDINKSFGPEEYVVADKVYALERHIITPYKESLARRRAHSALNYALSVPRVKIEYAFGILKACWPSLYDLPVRIAEPAEPGHENIIDWTLACIVLHNMLASMKDDESWLEEIMVQNAREGGKERERYRAQARETEGEAKREGARRRNDLRDAISLQN